MLQSWGVVVDGVSILFHMDSLLFSLVMFACSDLVNRRRPTNSFISFLVFCLGFQPCDPLQVCIRVLWREVHSSVWLLGGERRHTRRGQTKGGFRLRFSEMNIYTMTPPPHTHTHPRHQSIPISTFLKPKFTSVKFCLLSTYMFLRVWSKRATHTRMFCLVIVTNNEIGLDN